jgi:hypothetical protein
MKLILLGLCLIAFSSCYTNPNSYYYAPTRPNSNSQAPVRTNTPVRAGDLTTLSVGMTKSDVLRIKGRPDEIRAQGGSEYLLYTNSEMVLRNGTFVPNGEQYFVRLINGRVEAYGKLGDFGSTQQSPRTTIQVY